MTGKEMLEAIGNLDGDLIVEGEFGTFRKRHTGMKKKLFIPLAATLLAGALAGAAAFTRWSNTVQFGSQPSEEIKKQAEESGLSVVPSKGEQAVSATDQGITVTLAQTLVDVNGGKLVFRIDGFDLPEGKAPWAWWEFGKDGEDFYGGWGAGFFNGLTQDDDGNALYVKNGEPVRKDENGGWILGYQMKDGSLEYYIDFTFKENDGRSFGKEISVKFLGFGIQGEKFEDEDIMTVPGNWELRWTLRGSTQEAKKWTPNAKIGNWGVTLLEAEIGQYSMKTTYTLDEMYPDAEAFHQANGWDICPAGVRLRDGTDITEIGSSGGGSWDPETRTLTRTANSLRVILDPSQVVGMYFYAGYELNEKGYRVDKPYYYIPFE